MTAAAPERWRVDAADADVAVLVVPPALRRDRVFEVDLRLVVRTPRSPGAWFSVTLELDGAQVWSRRVEALCAGETDELDYRCRRVVAEGRGLRLRAITRVGGGARRHRLELTAEEVDDA